MHKSFLNHTALITGAAGGLGGAMAKQLAVQGARLMLLDKDSRGLDQIHDEICEGGSEAPGLCPLDLSIAAPQDIDELVTVLNDEFDGLHHLVHCAADFSGLSPLDQVRPADWLRCLQVNLNATWLLTIKCLPLLKLRSSSSVTFVLDDEDKSRSAYWGAYGISKSAIHNLAAMLDEELVGSGIRIVTVNPGPMRTGLRARAYFAENPESLADPREAARKTIQRISQAIDPGKRNL